MKKKVMSAVLAAAMVVGMAGNVVTVSAEEKYDLTLYSIDTTAPDFDGLRIPESPLILNTIFYDFFILFFVLLYFCC